MRPLPKLNTKTLDALFAWCQGVEKIRDEDRSEVAQLTMLAQPNRILASEIAPIGNVGAGEDNLMQYTIPNGVLAKDGYYLVIEGSFTTAANANNKTLKAKLGSTTLFDSGAVALNNKSIVVRCVIIRTGAAAESCYVAMNSNDGTLGCSGLFTSATESLASSVVFKFTGEATSNNDIVQKTMTMTWYPANIENA